MTVFSVLGPVAGLDRGIERFVSILRENGVETFESCEGGVTRSVSRRFGCMGSMKRVSVL